MIADLPMFYAAAKLRAILPISATEVILCMREAALEGEIEQAFVFRRLALALIEYESTGPDPDTTLN